VRGVTFFQRIKTPFTEGPTDGQARLQPRMRQIGEMLQERREDLGLDLDEIGAMLRIKPGYLAAIEQGRPHDLPGPTYAIGFVRAYADFLGLDSDAVLVRFKAEGSGLTARPDLALPVPLGERSLPGGALVLVALIVALCGYGIWYYLSTEARDRPERVAAVPSTLQAALVPPPGAVASSADNTSARSAPSSPALPGAAASPPQAESPQAQPTTPSAAPPVTPTPPQSTALSAATPATPNNPPPRPAAAAALPSPPAAQPSQRPAPQTASAAPVPSAALAQAAKVSIRAVADCWIQVRAADQSIVFSRVLKSGEVYAVPPRAGLSLRTGNAGALEIAVDGKMVPSIGGIGALRRDVALDPTELTAGTAVHG
jgi:cytoskeleton protein RodZ